MKNTASWWTLGMLLSVWGACPASSWAQGIPVIDAMGIAQAVEQTAAMAKDYATQIQMLETQASSMKSLTTGLGSSLNINPTTAIQQGLNAIKQGGAAAMSGGATDTARQLDSVYGTSGSTTVAPDQTAVTRTTEDTVRGASLLSAQQQDALSTDAQRLNSLSVQSQNATTALGAQQAGNQINAEVGQQLLQMRTKQLAQDRAVNAEIMEKEQERKRQKAVADYFIGPGAP